MVLVPFPAVTGNYKETFMYKYFFILWLFTLLNSCRYNRDPKRNLDSTLENKGLIKIDIDQFDGRMEIFMSSAFKQFKFIPLETNENCLIGKISHVERKRLRDAIF